MKNKKKKIYSAHILLTFCSLKQKSEQNVSRISLPKFYPYSTQKNKKVGRIWVEFSDLIFCSHFSRKFLKHKKDVLGKANFFWGCR